MNLYLIRHGATLENERKCYLGWTDAELSPQGIRQAKQLAAYFQGRAPHSLYCSDLKRTTRTAEIIANPHGLKPEASPLLRELNFGKWEGLTWEQIKSAYPEQLKLWLKDPFQHSPPGGEHLRKMKQRTDLFLDKLLQAGPPGRNILVVAHGGTIRLWLMRLLSLSRPEFWNLNIGTASVSLLHKSGDRFCPVYLNKTIYKEELNNL